MPVLKRLGIVSVAKITAVIGVIAGLITGIIVALIAMVIGGIATSPTGFGASPFDVMGSGILGGAGLGAFGILAIVILPIVYGIGGFHLRCCDCGDLQFHRKIRRRHRAGVWQLSYCSTPDLLEKFSRLTNYKKEATGFSASIPGPIGSF